MLTLLFCSLISRLKSSLFWQLLASCLVLSLTLVIFTKRRYTQHPPLPPGPWSLPFFGSVTILYQFIRRERHKLLTALAKKYGKIFAFKVGRQQLVFLNNIETITEAFVTKGDVLSDRFGAVESERSPMMNKIGVGNGVISANLGKEYKIRKQLIFQSMRAFGFGGKLLDETVWDETKFLVDEFRKHADGKTPTCVQNDLMHLAVSNVICSVVFGRRFDYQDEAFCTAIDSIRWILTNSSLILRIPIIRNLFAAKKQMAHHHDTVLNFIEKQIQSHKEDFDLNSPRDFIDVCLEKAANEEAGLEDKSKIGTENIRKIINDLFFAGTDTTAASLSWFLLYMVRFPDVQEKCRREIRNITESSEEITQIPSQKELPYTTATLNEVLRMASIAPMGLAHKARQDTTIDGYHIPKGALIFPNIFFMHLDEKNWEAPLEFKPRRWLDADGTTILPHPNFVPFSVGKRRCLGESLAKIEFFSFAVHLLCKLRFKMENPDHPPSLEGYGGIILSPHRFKIVMETV